MANDIVEYQSSDDEDENSDYSPDISQSGDVIGKHVVPKNFGNKKSTKAAYNKWSQEVPFIVESSSRDYSLEKVIPQQVTDASSVLVDHIICHPFTMMRMMCQVNYSGRWPHIMPFSVPPLFYYHISEHGAGSVWKGLKSCLILQGFSRVTETAISGLTNYPLEARSVHSFQQLMQHLILKAASSILMTPFYASFVFETVQSYSASDSVGILDGVRNGFARMFEFGSPAANRAVPVWKLAVPMMLCSVGHYLVYKVVKGVSLIYIRHRFEAERAFNRDKHLPLPYKPETEIVYPHILSSIFASFAATTCILPIQTAFNRLCIQGTRCIIDNSDVIGEVLPINTQYKGLIHCLTTIIGEEGHIGLYRGFGVLTFQFALQLSAVYFLQPFLEQAIELSKHMN